MRRSCSVCRYLRLSPPHYRGDLRARERGHGGVVAGAGVAIAATRSPEAEVEKVSRTAARVILRNSGADSCYGFARERPAAGKERQLRVAVKCG